MNVTSSMDFHQQTWMCFKVGECFLLFETLGSHWDSSPWISPTHLLHDFSKHPKKTQIPPANGSPPAKTEAQICICDGEDDKAKEAEWFFEIVFFSKTFLASSTSLLGLFFNGLAQFSMIFCQILPYLGYFVASFCLTKGGNGKGQTCFSAL